MIDFISSVVSGVTANGVTRVLEALWGSNKAHNIEKDKSDTEPSQQIEQIEEQPERLFQNFHIKNGFESILNSVNDPIVHFVIEDQPTTAWHLVTIVVESTSTGEWYVSEKGEMSFEGSGGGLFVANRVIEICKDRKLKNTAWVLPQAITNKLSQGELHWNQAKLKLIPLLSYSLSEYFIDYIAKKYSEITK